MFARLAFAQIAFFLLSAPVFADDLAELKARSDQWWELWTPTETADLDLAFEIEGKAVGFGYFGDELRSIEDGDAWKKTMRAWLDTLQSLTYENSDRQITIIDGIGFEWGKYHERQVKKSGEVRRDHVGRYTMTWLKADGEWRIASYHRSAITTP